MNFVFISANFPQNYWQFCQALQENQVRVLAIADVPYDELSEELKCSISDYYHVFNMEDYDQVYRACAYFIHRYGRIDALESNNEYWLERDAHLRSDFNIEGLNVHTIEAIRYKSKMKKYYEMAGCKVARYHLTSTLEEGLKFIEKVGYPVVVKPDNGMGAICTYRINDLQDLEQFYRQEFPSVMIMEEFICGDLISYDGIADSQRNIVYETAHVFVTPIMEIVSEGKDLTYYSLKEIDDDLKQLGRKVVQTFDTHRRFFHCEFFRLSEDKDGLGKKGELIGLEVNMRPPGGCTPDMMNYARNINVYRIWADMMVYNQGFYDLNHPSQHCAFASRKDQYSYEYTKEEIGKKYDNQLVMNYRGPDALAGAMGNDIFVAKFDSLEEVNQFIEDVIKKQN